MTQKNSAFGYSDGDIDTNRSGNTHLSDLVAERYSRRQTLLGGISAAATAVFGAGLLSACDDDMTAPPTVSVGQTGAASSGQIVTLTGTASGVASTWSQVSGTPVTLAKPDSTTTTFLAPSVSAATTLLFRLTTEDAKGKTSTADASVTINPATLGFAAVAKSLADVVAVPAGYSVTVLQRTGDPILAGVAAYANDGSDTNFAGRAGDHHDGMTFFGLAASGAARDDNSNTRGMLAMNHENINQIYLHPNGPTNSAGARPEAEALKEIECHGVSITEMVRAANDGAWSFVTGGALNRRITPLTPMNFTGPVRGSALLKTIFSPTGVAGRGTVNNCANGRGPWGTYITCEENWAGYFRRDASDTALRTAKENVAMTRYGLGTKTGNFGWTTVVPADPNNANFRKFNITIDATKAADGTGDYRYEANQFGWVLEIDPFDVASTPRKRTALGRMNHEGCWPGPMVVGRKPAFYMGDDAANEYVYKFVSASLWVAADATPADRLATGDKYLDNGTLYVARFDAAGTGTWIPLVFGQGGITSANATYAFADQADVLMHCRIAADIVGATKMDRPEWTAINPVTGEMYLTCTQNTTRTPVNTGAANPRAYTDPKVPSGQTNGNANGHIIRLRETGDTTEATAFTWDIYLFGSGADLSAANINVSGLDASNDFSMCDGMSFARSTAISGQVKPLMWIETDDNAFTDVTNCMLLAAIPGIVGDGTTKTITNTIGANTGTQSTRVGAAPGANLKRFLVGPKECEITGIDMTPDGRTLFVNIQHPGENAGNANAPTSNWPASQNGSAPATSRPRSATIAITKNDGGVVGL